MRSCRSSEPSGAVVLVFGRQMLSTRSEHPPTYDEGLGSMSFVISGWLAEAEDVMLFNCEES